MDIEKGNKHGLLLLSFAPVSQVNWGKETFVSLTLHDNQPPRLCWMGQSLIDPFIPNRVRHFISSCSILWKLSSWKHSFLKKYSKKNLRVRESPAYAKITHIQDANLKCVHFNRW